MYRILIVDDEAIIATQLEERLQILGYQVVGIASSGEEAVEYAREYLPDLILMDIVLSGEMSGIDASTLIKKELQIPIIFLTGYADDSYVHEALNVEPFGYILKPFQEKELKACIEVALYKKDIDWQLKESEERYRSVVDTALDGILILNADTGIISCNNAAARILGKSAQELHGQPFCNYIEDFADKSAQKVNQSDVGKIRYFCLRKNSEVSYVTASGSRIFLDLAMTSWNVRGNEYFTVFMRDVTERHIAEEKLRNSLLEKEVLLKEVHHRVKGNLQVISSLLNLQSKYILDKDILELFNESKHRIDTIALIHEKLYQTENLAEIEFSQYIRSLTHSLLYYYQEHLGAIELKYDIDHIHLEIDKAIPCALIINELVSNALKYAFPNQAAGIVSISFKKTNQGQFQLKIADNGIGWPKDAAKEHGSSLGLQLVNMLSDQLHGTIDFNISNGVECSMIIPAGN